MIVITTIIISIIFIIIIIISSISITTIIFVITVIIIIIINITIITIISVITVKLLGPERKCPPLSPWHMPRSSHAGYRPEGEHDVSRSTFNEEEFSLSSPLSVASDDELQRLEQCYYDPRLVEWRNFALLELGWHYVAADSTLHNGDYRSFLSRMSALRHRQCHMAAGQALPQVQALLEQSRAEALRQDFTFLSALPRNDLRWLSGLGGEHAPGLRRVLQVFQRMLCSLFTKRLDNAHLARTMANVLTSRAQGMLYVYAVMAIWPLLGREQRGRVQRWYATRPPIGGHRTAPPAGCW